MIQEMPPIKPKEVNKPGMLEMCFGEKKKTKKNRRISLSLSLSIHHFPFSIREKKKESERGALSP